jgi:positive phototaxis protein PixI
MTQIAAPPDRQTFLSFAVNSQVSALLPSGQLREVLSVQLEEIMPISGMSEAVMGVCNWRGEVLWLIDFGVVLQCGRLCDRALLLPQYDVIIAQSAQGAIGLVVESVGQMRGIEPTEIYPAPSAQPWLQGYWQSPDRAEKFALLDLDRLLQTL